MHDERAVQQVSTMMAAAVQTVDYEAHSSWSHAQALVSSEPPVGYAPRASAVEDDSPTAKAEPASETALADLYAKYAPAIYAHCRRFLQSPAAARDATQEAFVRVIARGVVLPREEEALRYLYRVSTNVCLNLLREHNVHTRAAPALAANTAHVPSAESGLADREFVTEVLERCGEGGAQVAILHYLDGMSQVDIADTLGITRRTVFNRLRKLSRVAGDLLRAHPRADAAAAREAKERK
jgi:RNA polymerase sigma-70 factor, ECF subfamily